MAKSYDRHPVINEIEGEKAWVSYAKRQVLKRNGCMSMVWIGKPGSGKSWGLLSYFCLINPDFQLDGNWYFKAGELMESIQKYEDDPKNDGVPGKIWGYDEAGIDLHNLSFANDLNKGLNHFLQTSRSRNYIFGITVPFISLLSKGVRTLMNMKVECQGWNKKTEETITAPKELEYNDDLKKFYSKRLILRNKNRESTLIDYMDLPKPPKDIRQEYEKRKKKFQSDLYKQIADKIKTYEESQNVKPAIIVPSLTFIQECVKKEKEIGTTNEKLAEKLCVSEGRIRSIFVELRKKGFKMQEFYDEDREVTRMDTKHTSEMIEE